MIRPGRARSRSGLSSSSFLPVGSNCSAFDQQAALRQPDATLPKIWIPHPNRSATLRHSAWAATEFGHVCPRLTSAGPVTSLAPAQLVTEKDGMMETARNRGPDATRVFFCSLLSGNRGSDLKPYFRIKIGVGLSLSRTVP